MSSRSTIFVAAGIAILAFGATDAFAHGGGHGGGGGGGGGHMGGGGGHMGGFGGHHGHFVGGVFVPYDDDYYDYNYEYNYEDCPLVHARVRTRHGLRWRWVRYCGD
jgi:hypothetical protein